MDPSERYIEPTVVDFGTDEHAFASSEIMQDETFGPIIPIFRFKEIPQVINFIRARPKPLGLYCFCTNESISDEILRRTSSGGAIINDVIMHLSNNELPFGGVRYLMFMLNFYIPIEPRGRGPAFPNLVF